jgi:pimeloyl-ACP methyl ester carboxylesterase
VDAPVVLLPHGYPASSFEFRGLMPALGDRWRLVAPDAPGFGYSDTPTQRTSRTRSRPTRTGSRRSSPNSAFERYVIYLHDYGSQFGLELAIRHPERVAGLVIQNGDIYEDEHGPKYEALKAYWRNPTPEGRAALAENISEKGFRDEFVGEVPPEIAQRITPDLWQLHWSLMTPGRHEYVRLFHDQAITLERFRCSRPTCASTSRRPSSCGACTTATCPRAPRARTSATCPTRSSICSTAATGCSKATSAR